MIMNMSERVIVNLTKKHRTVQERMEDVMEGSIIATEASRIYDAGQAKGLEQGNLENVRNLMETMNLTCRQAMDALKIPPEKQDVYAKKLGME